MKILGKIICLGMIVTMVGMGLWSCGGKGNDGIVVVSREDGSGTRGAFVELFGIEEKDSTGVKVDHTTVDAQINSNTAVMMTTVGGNKDAIGYISLGSLNDSVKALIIDGAVASVQNIKSGEYKISRPFNIAIKNEGVNEVVQEFIGYILSSDGQKIVMDKGYIELDGAKPFEGKTGITGKIVIGGSSSVAPVMEALKEGYMKVNSGVEVEIQQTDSTSGISSVADGVCDIGMASRELKDSEIAKGISGKVIALDGIAVIVNKENLVDELSSEQVKSIFTGNTKNWSEISK